MIPGNKKLIATLILIFIIVPTILFSVPKKAHAQWAVFDAIVEGNTTVGTGTQTLDWGQKVLQQVIMAIEKQFLEQLTKSVDNWINTGFNGNPLYLQNSGAFFTDIAKFEIKNIVDTYGYDPNRFPFGKNFALNAINAYKTQAADNAAYTLSNVINDPNQLQAYQNNFSAGGWNGFLVNTQYPQNNIIGFTTIVTQQEASQLAGTVQNAAQKVTSTLQQGLGFLSPKTCPSNINPNYNNLSNEFDPPSFDDAAYDDANPIPDPSQLDANGCTANWTSGGACYGSAAAFNEATYDAANPEPEVTENENGQYCFDSSVSGNPLCYDTEDEAQSNADSEWQTAHDDAYNAALEAIQTGWMNARNSAEDVWDSKNTCVDANGKSALQVTTPGSVVASQITQSLGTTFSKSVLGTELGGSISSILDTLVNHFLNEGLSSLTSVVNQAPGPDTWSYYGNTLSGTGGTNIVYGSGGTTTTTGSAGPLSASPTSVSVTSGNATNVTISGGTLPYNITTQPDVSMAVAYMYNNILSIADVGVQPGTTSVVVQDSSTPAKTVTIQIGANGSLPTFSPPGGSSTPGTVTCTTDATTGAITCQQNSVLQTATPTSTWSPTQTTNGWWPQISPDGRYVSYGNWGESWVTDLQTGQNYDFSKADGSLPDGSRCIAGNWIEGDTLSFVCEIGSFENQGKDGFDRFEVKVGEWIAHKTSDDPMLVNGNNEDAADGHWISYLASSPSRLAADNAVLATGTGGIPRTSQGKFAYMCNNDNTVICVNDGTNPVKTYSAGNGAVGMDFLNGYILYSQAVSTYGRELHGIDPSGKNLNFTVSPWGGESAPNLFTVNGQIWMASQDCDSSAANANCYTFLRPWGSIAVISVKSAGVLGSVVDTDGNIMLAEYSDKGVLTILTVPDNSPRSTLPSAADSSGVSTTPDKTPANTSGDIQQ